jgi:hypothetical protein
MLGKKESKKIFLKEWFKTINYRLRILQFKFNNKVSPIQMKIC